MTDPTKHITAEIVARFAVPRDTPTHRLLVHKTLSLPLHVAPTQPGNGWVVEADFLTFQARISDGDLYLSPLPYRRDLSPLVDTRQDTVVRVLNDYRVGRGVPGGLEQVETLARRIVAALDDHTRRVQA